MKDKLNNRGVFYQFILFFMSAFMSALCALSAHAEQKGCPDPSEIKIQSDRDSPHFYTDSGWISDTKVQDVRNSQFKLVMVTIFNPWLNADFFKAQSVKCTYDVKMGNGISQSFDLLAPYGLTVKPTGNDWPTDRSLADYICAPRQKTKCEFSIIDSSLSAKPEQ